MTATELKVVLEKHRMWLDSAPGGVKADFSGANLWGANLYGANLYGANLYGADLSGANLRDANLRGANLRGAKYNDKTMWPAPSMVLLALWGEVSDQLCADLMAHDAANHPEPKSFNVWKKTGACPYGNLNFQRSANFREKPELWNARLLKKNPTAISLVMRLLKEKLKKVK
mgnify:CR=1 FL=1